MYEIEINDDTTLTGLLQSFENLKDANIEGYVKINGEKIYYSDPKLIKKLKKFFNTKQPNQNETKKIKRHYTYPEAIHKQVTLWTLSNNLLFTYYLGITLKYIKEENKEDLKNYYVNIYSDDKYSTYQCDFRPVPGTASFDESMKKNGRVIVRRNEFPVSRDILRIPFESIYINVPRNYDEWLKSRYGERYMIPDPDFQDKDNNPNMYLWSGVNAIYKKCL